MNAENAANPPVQPFPRTFWTANLAIACYSQLRMSHLDSAFASADTAIA